MSQKREEYFGQCMRCKEVIKKSQMTRHLKKCIDRDDTAGGASVKLFHLIVEGDRRPTYWLHVEIPGTLPLAHLDSFLRDIWLECCGHLSCFTIKGERYSVEPMEEIMFGMHEEGMEHRIDRVLGVGTKFQHEYDYGSTTDLKLRVAAVYERQTSKPDIVLLARNQAPTWKCAKCGKPATQLRASGWGMDGESVLCDTCAGQEDEESFLPIVNSPRTGVCGYCG